MSKVVAKTYMARLDEHGLHLSPGSGEENDPLAQKRQSAATSAFQWRQAPARSQQAFAMRGAETTTTIQTVSVRRENEQLFNAGVARRVWSVRGNTAQSLLHPNLSLVEHYETRAEGVEVAWVIRSPLPGTGSLSVEAELSGLTYLGATERGYHFADGSGTACVRVGFATAVDAAHHRWELPIEAAGNRFRVQVAPEILNSATYPLAIDPLIWPEFGMDRPVLVFSNVFDDCSVAANSNLFLVVWADTRTAEVTGNQIYGARVSREGLLLDPTGIRISAGFDVDPSSVPTVAGNSNDFLLVWAETRTADRTHSEIVGSRVSDAGLVLDPTGIPICTNSSAVFDPVVAAGGTNFLVAWTDQRNSSKSGLDIYGSRVTSSGTVLDPEGIPICTNALFQSEPAVAGDGNEWFVVWTDSGDFSFGYPDIYGSRVTSAGAVLDGTGIPISTNLSNPYSPSVAANGSGFLVVWAASFSPGAFYNIFGARVTGAGALLDPDGIPISIADGDQLRPAVAAGSNDFFVVWQDSREFPSRIYGAFVSATGAVLVPDGIPLSSQEFSGVSARVATLGSEYLVVRSAYGSRGVLGVRVDAEGNVLDKAELLISQRRNREQVPAVAWNGSEYLVVWEDDRNLTPTRYFRDIYGVRIGAEGIALDPSGIAVCTHASDKISPAVAASGGDFLVVWVDKRDSQPGPGIYGTGVSGAGSIADTSGYAIVAGSFGERAPAVASNGKGYLVVWRDLRNAASRDDVYAARVNRAGAVLDLAGIAVCTTTNRQAAPVVASDGSDFLVVWRDERNENTNSPSGSDIFGARLNWAGVVAETNGFKICGADGDQRAPEAASNGEGYLVVWRDLRNQSTSGSDIFGARLSSGGAVLEPNGFPICTLAGDQFEPSVAASGGDYLVVWQDTRTVPAPAPLRDQQARIFGTRVTRDGGLLDGPGLMMNSRLLDPDVLAVVGGDAGEFLIVGEGVSDGAFRVVANLFWADFPPRIRFAGTPNGWLVAWPNPSTGFVLQENTNLDSASWVNVATPPMIVGEEKQLTVPARFTNRFYRLRK